jgi:ABC-type proline/glycine betaine transport system substrate-binding protein
MEYTADELVSVFIKIRDKKRELEKEMNAKIAELEEQMTTINRHLLDICKTNGVESVRTKHGTAYRTIKNRYWTNDWEQFHKFMQEHGAMDLLERRIQQSNMRQFLEENPDLHPIGLTVDSEYAITVRRK